MVSPSFTLKTSTQDSKRNFKKKLKILQLKSIKIEMEKIESIEATLVVKTDNILGECPLWSGNEVLWIDIDGKKFWAYVV